MAKEYYVYETTTVGYTVEADSEEQAIEDMEYELDTVIRARYNIDRDVWAEENRDDEIMKKVSEKAREEREG
jgi:hypothetical protein